MQLRIRSTGWIVTHLVLGVIIAAAPLSCSMASAAKNVIPARHVTQGHGTALLQASATQAATYLGLDTDNDGGLDIPLTNAENDYICSMQRSLSPDASTALIEWLARTMADIINRDAGQIMPALKDPSYCSQRSAPARVRKADIIVHLNKRGTVVSQNPVWNACVSGTDLPLALIRSNKDTIMHRQGSLRKIFVRTCRDYHRGDLDLWQHPDYPGLEMQLDSKGRLLSGLPNGFVAKKDVKDVPADN